MDFGSGFMTFVPYWYILIVWILWMDGWEGNMPDYWYLLLLLLLVGFLLETCWVMLVDLFLPPMNIEDNVQFRFGGTFSQHHCAWFLICVTNFSKIFAILPYLSMLYWWRLFFSWCSEELCIFANVWFRLTTCNLGCHWNKCVNLFLLMWSELSNLLEG